MLLLPQTTKTTWQVIKFPFGIFTVCVYLLIGLSGANIVHTVLGVPNECLYQNSLWQCRLSFSCWLEGGRHVNGCGSQNWLFSCCVFDHEDDYSYADNSISTNIIRKAYIPPNQKKRNAIRRRADQELTQLNCGIPRNFNNILQKRIIGGRPAQFAEFAWQAHIRIAEFQCGGVLVSQNFVATAAHCIKYARLKDIIVYLGELDTQNSGNVLEPLPVEKHRVIQKIIHPKFRFRMTQPDRFDIAVMRLAQPAGYRAHISPICLPSEPINLVGRMGVIAGWGKTDSSSGQTGTNILRTAMVPIISRSDCIEWHESKQIDIDLYPEMFCAGHEDGHQDACLGDSGGPLIVMQKNRYYLVGITSAGFGCGVGFQPGIYLNVQKTLKWLRNIIF
ncbi:serine proteinase stubble [Culicoides brevitarsis]|uniref:serine proteinase stubble n=1 Tax=Culicoides brevitarsis TaxID=469753 RepID=UPI00307C1717